MTHPDAATHLATLQGMTEKAERFLTQLEAVLTDQALDPALRTQYEDTQRDAKAGWNALAWALQELRERGN